MNPILRAIHYFGVGLFAGYIICAGIATFVDIGLLYILTDVVGIWYLHSAAISYCSGMITNYTLNKYLNFKDRSRRILAQFGLFTAVALVGLALNQIILCALVSAANLTYILAKFIAVFLVMIWSFYGHRNFTFRILA